MSVLQMGLVWKLDLPHPQQVVLLALADHAHDDGTNARPSLGYIAWKTGYSLSSVKRIAGALRAKGLIQVEEQGGGRTSTVYLLCLEQGKQKPPYYRLRSPIDRVHFDTGITGSTAAVSPVHPQPLVEPSVVQDQDQVQDQKRRSSTLAPTPLRVVFAFDGFDVPPPLLEQLKAANPAVGVEGEILRAHLWAVANPAKRKRNWARFLVNWMARVQERGGSRDGGGQTLEERQAELLAGYRRALSPREERR